MTRAERVENALRAFVNGVEIAGSITVAQYAIGILVEARAALASTEERGVCLCGRGEVCSVCVPAQEPRYVKESTGVPGCRRPVPAAHEKCVGPCCVMEVSPNDDLCEDYNCHRRADGPHMKSLCGTDKGPT